MNRSKLFSIGEISKITGASIKSLRYYERISILKPAYVDPGSGYRYYSFNQIYMIELIKFAIEMDIPLKQLSDFLYKDDTFDFSAFTAHAKELAEKKIKALERGLRYIDFLNQQSASQNEYPVDSIYKRKLPEKYFYVIPYERTFDLADYNELNKLFCDALEYEDSETGWQESGFLHEYSYGNVKRYIFAETTRDKSNREPIPGGYYHCRKSDACSNEQLNIEHSKEIFAEYLAGKDNFTAIETGIAGSKMNINKIISELRVITL